MFGIGGFGRATLVASLAAGAFSLGAPAFAQVPPGYQYPPPQPYPAQPYQPYPAQPYPAQPYPAQPAPAQPYPAQPYPAAPYPAQPYPAQPYPAQPYPAQPYPGGQSSASWVPSSTGMPMPAGAVYGGSESNGAVSLYVCQAAWNGGLHPGKLWNGHCYIAYGQQEVKLSSYNVLVAPRARWGNANQPGAAPLIGGHENNHDFYICRGPLFADDRQIGIEVGKYFSTGCQVSFGKSYYITSFQELYVQ
jgi:hypothetical protein